MHYGFSEETKDIIFRYAYWRDTLACAWGECFKNLVNQIGKCVMCMGRIFKQFSQPNWEVCQCLYNHVKTLDSKHIESY